MTVGPNANPLLEMLNDTDRIPFDRIEAHHVEPAVDALLAEAQGRLEALAASRDPRTYENTMTAMEGITERLGVVMGIVGHLEGVATTPELRAAYNAVQPKVSEFSTNLTLHPGLYGALKAFAATPAAKALPATRARFVEKTLAEFRRQGAELDAPGKERLAALDVELTKLTVRYGQNVLDATNAFELVVDDEKRLAGLPESAREAARASAADKGKKGWRFTLQAPSYIPLLTYADDEGLREHAWRAYNTRATAGDLDNRKVLADVLRLRRERAKLLGFSSFADLVLDDRMAKRGETARSFVERLRGRTQPFFDEENRALVAFRRSAGGKGASSTSNVLPPWDVTYWAEKQRVALYDFDDEALRPYFEAEAVMKGLFELAYKLYGVRIEAWAGASTWHPTVRPYRVLDEKGTWVGSFYADLFPRETKRDGAWMDGMITGRAGPGGEVTPRHVETLAANVRAPSAGKPALLNHREVETLFHEFGHLLHHVLSKVDVRSMAGCNVAWDFVELPSQIMENWSWEKEVLSTFARHYQTGAPLPDDLLAKMKRAKNYRAANAMMRQLGFAACDLALHVDYEPSRDGEAVAYARKVFSAYSPAALPDDYAMIASFSHLFASPVGYAAGYYSYKWAEVLDADAFSRFQKEGLVSGEVGRSFRDSILSQGDSRDPLDLYRAFMGRDPDEGALLQRSGLSS